MSTVKKASAGQERDDGLERTSSEVTAEDAKNRESYDRGSVTGEKENGGKKRWTGMGWKKDKTEDVIR
jgi:hypothetical protein